MLYFATGNARKIIEASQELAAWGIDFQPQAVSIDEIQHQDPAEITKQKARSAFLKVRAPVVVQDTNWSIPALGGFPGGYMKDVAAWWSAADWLAVIDRHEDRTIICQEHIVYYDGQQLMHFVAEYPGVISKEARGSWGNSIEKVVCLYGDQTLAEVHDAQGVASAALELRHWKQFAAWYDTRMSVR